MRSILGVLFVLLLLGSASSATTYCSDLFNNTHNLVNSAIYSSATFSGLLSISLLIVLMVLVVLALVYGIGIGFGINKLVVFVKSEYIESVFNILFIILIVGGMASLTGISGFFANAALINSGTASNQTTASFSSMNTLYINLCNNILNNQIIPAASAYVGFSLLSMGYTLFSGFEVSVFFSGTYLSIVPSFIINPFDGLNFLVQLVGLELSALVIMLGISASLIFLFFVIYFLFPVFLYLGILFRSFPWTRAAGGTFLALFISFYLVFPALIYPITSIPSALTSVSNLCSAGQGKSSNLQSVPCITSNTDLLSYLSSYIEPSYNSGSLIAELLVNPVGLLSDAYAVTIAYFALMLTGVFIAFLVAYDLSDILAKTLGAPSFKPSRIMSSVL